MTFRILTAGWEPDFADRLLTPIEKLSGIEFTHGLVGNAARLRHAQQRYPSLRFVALSNTAVDQLPVADLDLLRSIEGEGVPTVKSMVQGDRVLRHRPEAESLGYATLLARRLETTIKELRPNVVLASFDSLHSGISLAVAKACGVPWVALAFPVIPDNLTGFCKGLTPESLVPIERPVDEALRALARTLIQSVRARQQSVVAYRSPVSLAQWLRQYRLHGRNWLRRRREAPILGIDRLTYPSAGERVGDVVRRSLNRLRLPTDAMLTSPPTGRYVYYPFHMAPESMVDTWAPLFQNQLAFLAQLSLAMPADVTFVAKLHFSDPDNYGRGQLRELTKLPRLRIAHPSAKGSDFLEKAALVIGIQGTSCLEAALLGKSVLIFGDSPYQHFPRTERARRPDELSSQIRRMLELAPPADAEVEDAFAAYMARYMPGRVNDWNQPLADEDLRRFADCFLALRTHVEAPGVQRDWYEKAPFVAAFSDSRER